MSLLDKLRGGLVVSCQPVDGGPMDRPEIVAAMAAAAVAGGASGVRIEGIENLLATRKLISVPVIGIVKRDDPGTPVRITPRLEDAMRLITAGADIVAVDGTSRPRPDSFASVANAVRGAGRLVMADCSTRADGAAALAAGAAIIGTTLSGYTDETMGNGAEGSGVAPDLELVRVFRALGGFVMAEGRYNTPELAASALAAGADCVTVGSALTRLEHVTGWFRDALARTTRPGDET